MSWVIIRADLRGRVVRPSGEDDDGLYLAAYDPDWRPDGNPVPFLSGLARWTDDIAEAMTFETTEEAFDLYLTQSTAVPRRADGRPNRPLTAYSILVEEVPT